MHNGVEPGLDEDEHTDELVDVDVVVERQEEPEAQLTQFRYSIAMDK